VKGAADQVDTFGHAGQAVAGGRLTGSAPDAVVVDGQSHVFAGIGDVDDDPRRVARVAHRVGDRLLCYGLAGQLRLFGRV